MINLENFLRRLKTKDNDAIKQLYEACEGFIVKNYNKKIKNIYGNEYWDDYLSEVTMSIFSATLHFKGKTQSNYKSYIYETILNCIRKVIRDKCDHQYRFKSLDNENDLECVNYIEKNFISKKDAIFKEAMLNDDLMTYLESKLKPLEIQLFNDVYYRNETLKYFAETHNRKYSTIRSIFYRMKKKLKYEEIKSILY